MKIVHVNYYDIKGGAAKAAYRLHCGLLQAGHDSAMLVAEKHSNDDSIIEAFDCKKLKRIHFNQHVESSICRILRLKHDMAHAINLFSSNLPEIINSMDLDIVHLHWVNGCMLSVEDIAKIKYPIVWTMHDNWGYSAAEHYHKSNDNSFINGYKGILSINKMTWQRKCRAWHNIPFNIVSPSNWIGREAAESMLFKKNNVTVIPNGIDLNIFRSMNKDMLRKKWGIERDKKIVAFGAFAVNDNNKGGTELCQALDLLHLEYDNQVEVLLIGNGRMELPFKTHYGGYVEHDQEIVELYSLADVFILASKYDNLPNMIVEAMACSTPCVGFDIGGIPDMIEHQQNGYLAKAFDCKDFAHGIQWILDNPKYDKICYNTRKTVEDKFDIKKVVSQYTKLYKKVLAQN